MHLYQEVHECMQIPVCIETKEPQIDIEELSSNPVIM